MIHIKQNVKSIFCALILSTALSVPAIAATQIPESATEAVVQVWLSATGEKYHNKPDCGRMNPNKARQVALTDAIASGYEACQKCFP